MAGFRSLSERTAGTPSPDEVLPLDVLPYMRAPLWGWLVENAQHRWETLAQMLKVDYSTASSSNTILKEINVDRNFLLDVVDARLSMGSLDWQSIRALQNVLFLAGSGWRVSDSQDGLEQVVNETVGAVVKIAAAAEGSAGDHLAAAWAATYSKNRNPTHAHGEMIRAVESAARPVVTPKNHKATLGTLIGQLKAQGSLYKTTGSSAANDGVAATLAMMEVLWQQQTDRHGANPTTPATQGRVEFLMPIAAALVHAFDTGAVHRKG